MSKENKKMWSLLLSFLTQVILETLLSSLALTLIQDFFLGFTL